MIIFFSYFAVSLLLLHVVEFAVHASTVLSSSAVQHPYKAKEV
jgi:hypothetical protein